METKQLTKEEKFIQYLDERMFQASSYKTCAVYAIVKEKFLKIFEITENETNKDN